MKKLLFFILLLPLTAFSKNLDTTGALTFLSLTKKFSAYSSLTFYHYDVFSFDKKEFQRRSYPAGLIQSYFQTSYSYQYLPTVSLTVGHIYQRNNPLKGDYQNENRIFEQVTLGVNYRDFSLSHRLRLEERFVEQREENETDFRTRLRYQIGAKIPLRGLVVDPDEYYINTYNEVYFSTTGERNAFFSDDWFYLGLGLKTKTAGSFEIGPLVQWAVVNRDKDTKTQYTLQTGWLYSF